jgi:hypothetical protein
MRSDPRSAGTRADGSRCLSGPSVSPFSYKGVGTPSPRGSAAGFSLDGAARPRAHCTDGSPHHGLGEYGERAEQPKQREKPQKPLRSDEAQPWVHGQSLLSVISKPDLLVEPNHHERKSNQKEEAWGCTVVFPVSHFIRYPSFMRWSEWWLGPGGPSAKGYVIAGNQTGNDYAIVRTIRASCSAARRKREVKGATRMASRQRWRPLSTTSSAQDRLKQDRSRAWFVSFVSFGRR